MEKNNNSMNSKNYIFKNLFIIAFPIAIYLLFQNLQDSVDHFIIARYKVGNSFSSNLAQLLQFQKTFIIISSCLGTVSVVLISREYSKNINKSRQYASLIFLISVFIGLFLFFIFFFGRNFIILKIARMSKDILIKGAQYYNVMLFSFLCVIINSIFISLERIKGNKKFVLFLNILIIFTKIVISYFLGIYFKEKITISHLSFSTLISNLIITIMAFYFMFSKENNLRIEIKNISFSKKIIKEIFKLTIILCIGKATYSMGKVWVNSLSSSYYGNDSDIMSVIGLIAGVNGICYSISSAFDEAQSVMISKCAGTKNYKQSFKIFYVVLIITFCIGILGFMTSHFFGQDIMYFLYKKDKLSFSKINAFQVILYFETTSLFTSVWASNMLTYMTSFYKKVNFVLFMNILRIICRLFCLFIFNQISLFSFLSGKPSSFGLSILISNLFVLIITFLLFIFQIKKKK
ncbi:sodium transporter [Texas Phoenix palm phytoplasma]|uniref:Sodium transporter n=1 Tax=Texas Phoenix palm phytoplasma TaxID=176709 RepID=A0ABS5BL36_9MOLU|nr:MATE family efflux transporter [Texas Phoenix palm phytoplasma]MBP3059487.1 sodium transporter [Texas Phoenix palm phytoplasma]